MKGIPVSVVGCLQGGFMEYLEDCSLSFFKNYYYVSFLFLSVYYREGKSKCRLH